VSAVYLSLNRNKRSIALRLPEGTDVLKRLVKTADVLIHNFRPGVMTRLGIDYKDLKEINPRLIYCSISGFGDVGPLSAKAGNDLVVQAYSGLMSYTGEPNGGPVRCPISIGDLTAGLYAATAILAALLERQRTGEGQLLKTSLLESMLAMVGYHLTDFMISGRLPQKMGSANMLGQPNQAFPTSDGSVVVSVISDAMWARCCAALELDEIARDPKFATLEARYRNRPELLSRVGARLRVLTTDECVARLNAENVTCSPINDLSAVAEDAQVAALGMLERVSFDGLSVPVVASPIQFGQGRPGARLNPPRLGEHTDAVLRDAGLSDASIDQLRGKGIVS
jgi:crotonobetainyl-CoA:carnitine CoA-transferase CaiB-like acyl-CoA transferase